MYHEKFLRLDALPEGGVTSRVDETIPTIEKGNQIHSIKIVANDSKARWLELLMGGFGADISIEKSSWDEERYPGVISPSKSSASKVSIGSSWENLNTNGGAWEVRLATDVIYRTESGLYVLKPRDAKSASDIDALLLSELREQREFKVTAAAALFGSDGLNQKGLTHVEGHKFSLAGLSPAEIELYIWGIKGRTGRSPSYLHNLVDSVVGDLGLSNAERNLLENGLSYDALKSTTMSLRLPNPLIQRRILSVDNIKRGNNGYDAALKRLFWSVLGAPSTSKILIPSLFRSQDADSVGEASLYPDLPGSWMQVVINNGSTYSITRVTEADCEAISAMAAENFRSAGTYAYLSDIERESLVIANSPNEVRQNSIDKSGARAFVVRCVDKGKDTVVGWAVLHCCEALGGAQIKRFHINPNEHGAGIGKRLLAVVEDAARDSQVRILSVSASGRSGEFFEHQQYKFVGNDETVRGVFQNSDTSLNMGVFVKVL